MPGWNEDNAAGSAGPGAVTLLEGSTFCISGPSGDMHSDKPHGTFYHDTRYVAVWNLAVNDTPMESLGTTIHEPYRATFIGRAMRRDGRADSPLMVERERTLGEDMSETITVRNYSPKPLECDLDLTVDTDFADLFEVKEGRPKRRWHQKRHTDGDRLILESDIEGHKRAIVVEAPGAEIDGHHLRYRPTLSPHGHWSQTVKVYPVLDGQTPREVIREEKSEPEGEEPLHRFLAWRVETPVAHLNDDALEKVLVRSQKDLGSLRIFNPDHPGRVVIAAGAPWFMALFGRDSLLSSYMALPLDPKLALGTLQTLAEHQGREVNPLNEEQPGRILHEVRLGASTGLALGGHRIYYGTADATPLFVLVLGELRRWGLEPEMVHSLLPAADRALEWVEKYGDRDGDGFVEYERLSDHGLVNQGWKDSWDGINFADGTLARPPIALCEVQGYVYAAYLGRALIALGDGDTNLARRWADAAARLKEDFNERFWLPDRGYYAIALDGDKKPVDALASNMGHCLWTGIVDEDKAASVAGHLMSREMFTGWGVRTLASTMGAYNPASYHNGSVWPHDSTLVAAGLMRYGFVEEAQKIALGLLEAADYFDGRLPELFCGLDREKYPQPVSYPTSCSPQAWAAASPIHLVRTLLRFDPGLPWNELWVKPALPAGFGHFKVNNVPLADDARLSVAVEGEDISIDGLPPHVQLRREPRPTLADLLSLTGLGRTPAEATEG